MAGLLSGWARAFEKSSFYRDFCVYLPEGLNNAYLDILIFIAFTVILILFFAGHISARKRQRRFELELLKIKAQGREGRRGRDGKDANTVRRNEKADTGQKGTGKKKDPETKTNTVKRQETSVHKDSLKSPATADKKEVEKGYEGNGRKQFDINELIRKKREEEERKQKNGTEGPNKLKVSIDQVKAEKDMESRLKEMDEESRKRAERNMAILSKQLEKRLKTDQETGSKRGGWV